MRHVLLACALASLGTGCRWDGTWNVPTPTLQRMQEQPRFDAYESTTFFPDRMTMRLPPEGTVAYGSTAEETVPPLDRTLLARGQMEFDTFCAPCHGAAGDGDTPVARDMVLRSPPSFDEPRIRALADRDIYGIITEGYGFMPSYAGRIRPRDRWAVIAYLRALELAREVPADWLPEGYQRALESEAP